MISAILRFVGNRLNRLGHRLTAWGWALEVRANKGRPFQYKVTYVDAKGEDAPRDVATHVALSLPQPTGKVRIYRSGGALVGEFFADEPRVDNGEEKS